MAQITISATGQKFYNALAAILAALPAGHPAIRHIDDAIAAAAFGDFTPVAANYVVLEPSGTITTYATASKAAMQTYVAAL